MILFFTKLLFAQGTSTLIDTRDDKTYKTVKIGNQIWMAENLNYKTDTGCLCYNNDPANCASYGRLYNWKTALNVCPDGWHLPDSSDFEILALFINKQKGPFIKDKGDWLEMGKYLKANISWDNKANGTDDFGFSGLAGGYSNESLHDVSMGSFGAWWTKTALNGDCAGIYYLHSDYKAFYYCQTWIQHSCSVRCIKNN